MLLMRVFRSLEAATILAYGSLNARAGPAEPVINLSRAAVHGALIGATFKAPPASSPILHPFVPDSKFIHNTATPSRRQTIAIPRPLPETVAFLVDIRRGDVCRRMEYVEYSPPPPPPPPPPLVGAPPRDWRRRRPWAAGETPAPAVRLRLGTCSGFVRRAAKGPTAWPVDQPS